MYTNKPLVVPGQQLPGYHPSSSHLQAVAGALHKPGICASPEYNDVAMDTGSPSISVPQQPDNKVVKFKSPELYSITTAGKRKRTGSGSTSGGSQTASSSGGGEVPHTGLTQDLTEMLRLRKRSCPNLRQFFGFGVNELAPGENGLNHHDDLNIAKKTSLEAGNSCKTLDTVAACRMSVDSASDFAEKVDLGTEIHTICNNLLYVIRIGNIPKN